MWVASSAADTPEGSNLEIPARTGESVRDHEYATGEHPVPELRQSAHCSTGKANRKQNPGNPEQRLSKLLEEAGATLLRTRKHQVVILRNGKRITLPKTPSDHRAALNAVGDVRRAMREPVRT